MNTGHTGARWWRFDFHAHTPASMDYGKGPDREALRQTSPEDWLLDFMRARVDCVAVTDHNTGEWIDRLKEAYSGLAEKRPQGFRALFLFPGVEITMNGGAHMLAMLDPTKTESDIDALLGAVGFPSANRGTSDACSEKSPQEVARTIRAHDGLAIPAHADLDKGILGSLSGVTLQRLLADDNLAAIELVDTEFDKPAIYEQSRPELAEVIGSDCHRRSGAAGQRYPGSHFTWVKMGPPALDGLRLALMDGCPLSVQRHDAVLDPNAVSHLVVDGLEVRDAQYAGRPTPLHVGFSPWMSTLIGGRGTGKSTIIEMLRMCFRRDDEVPPDLRREFDNFASVPSRRHGRGALTEATVVLASLVKDGRRFRVSWRQSGAGPAIEQEGDNGQWAVSPGEVADRFPIRVLSQKQVFALANDPNALLQLVDDAPQVDRRGWNAKWNETTARYLRLCSQARELAARLAERTRLEGQLADTKRQLGVFEEGGHRNLLLRYQRLARQRQILLDRAQELESGVELIRKAGEDVAPADVPSLEFEDSGESSPDSSALMLLQSAAAKQRAVSTALHDHATEFEEFRKKWLMEVGVSKWKIDRDRTATLYEALEARLRSEGVSDPGAYASLVQKRRLLEKHLAELGAIERRRRELETDAGRSLNDLEEQRRQLTEARIAFLTAVIGGNRFVRIDVTPFGDSARAAEQSFRDCLGRQDGAFGDAILNEDQNTGILAELYTDLSEESEKRSSEFRLRVRELKNSLAATREGGPSTPRRKRFEDYIRQMRPEQMDRLNVWWPEDGVRMHYKESTTGKFVPLTRGSPGQKSAAVLAFLLSHGAEPILLDQPEDDLDNHLIYDLIVQQLRENKTRRQVIVATHNPNIVVNGDAEQVIAMDHLGGQCIAAPEGTGTLSDIGVREEVCRVMEGGRRAFERRYRRLKEESSDA